MLDGARPSADKLEGFSVGADDYIVKPFDTPELLARISDVLASVPQPGPQAAGETT